MSQKKTVIISNYLINRLTPSDACLKAEKIVTIYRKSWINTYPNIEVGITVADIVSKFTGLEVIIKNWKENILTKKDRAVWIVQQSKNNEIIGFCVAKNGSKINELVYIYLLPAFEGKHLGTQLIKKALEWMGTDKPIELYGASYNYRAIKFYEKFGFQLSDKRVSPKPLPNGKSIPSIRMVKPAII